MSDDSIPYRTNYPLGIFIFLLVLMLFLYFFLDFIEEPEEPEGIFVRFILLFKQSTLL